MKMRITDPDDYKLNDPRWISYDEFTKDPDAMVGDSWNDTNDFVPDIERAGAIDIEVLPDDEKPNRAYYVRFTMPPYNAEVPVYKEGWLNILNTLMRFVSWGEVYQEEPEKIIVDLNWGR